MCHDYKTVLHNLDVVEFYINARLKKKASEIRYIVNGTEFVIVHGDICALFNFPVREGEAPNCSGHAYNKEQLWNEVKGEQALEVLKFSFKKNMLKQDQILGRARWDIPESCVACVFLHLTPPEICILARLNRAFRGAASSDAVWEAKLPANYQQLLDLLPEDRYQGLCKKDIFALLSRSVPFDDANKVVWLDRVTGRICMSISAKAMTITRIEDRRYWNWLPTEESRLDTWA
ncbi:F-box protein PP2-A15-like [Ipomoea triloba]|uniref:F-box protein PP2-A15-like n=1 Tax=Ipomoea triloba TaxID=35885 RepID=UPI00125D01D4|nr:F-box protein PP2-A15-like [Ipomoea triloba]